MIRVPYTGHSRLRTVELGTLEFDQGICYSAFRLSLYPTDDELNRSRNERN